MTSRKEKVADVTEGPPGTPGEGLNMNKIEKNARSPIRILMGDRRFSTVFSLFFHSLGPQGPPGTPGEPLGSPGTPRDKQIIIYIYIIIIFKKFFEPVFPS